MSLAKHSTIRWQVTGPALFVLLALLSSSLIAGESAASFFSDLQGAIVAQAGSFYIFSLTALLVLAIGLALSPAGGCDSVCRRQTDLLISKLVFDALQCWDGHWFTLLWRG